MSAIIEVEIDAAKTLALLRNGGKRMAYAVVNAINGAAKDVQAAERDRVQHEFTVRKSEFVMRQAAVIKGVTGSGFASVGAGRFEARIAVGQKPRLLLSGFEEGDERRPVKGKNVGVPRTGGPARPAVGASVRSEFTFSNLALRKQTSSGGMSKRKRRSSAKVKAHVTAKGKVQWKGTQRTFLLTETKKAPLGGVFQRVGPGRGDIRLVYTFTPPMRLKARLKFIETGRKIAEQRLPERLREEVNKSLAYNLTGVKL